MPETVQLEIEGVARVSATAFYATGSDRVGATLVLGHGAGANQNSPFMVAFGSGLASRGIETVTFNFPYMEEGRKAPDPAPKLEACYRAAIDGVRRVPELAGGRLFIGGKSLGGRIASHLAASDQPVAGLAGLVCLGYPLHAPNRPDKLRTKHLERIRVPILIVQGSRDALGTPEELRPLLSGLAGPSHLFVVEEGDHSFTVPKKWIKSQHQVYSEVLDEIRRFIASQPEDRSEHSAQN